jgi:hypothetical protein
MKKTLAAAALTLLPLTLKADVPFQIGFQGTFSSTGTLPTMEFRIVDSSTSSAPLAGWSESTAPFTTDGSVNLVLGAQSPLPRTVFTDPATSRYLWVKIGSDAPVREKLVSVPFAYQSSLARELAGGSAVQGTLQVSGGTSALTLTSANDQLMLEEPAGPANERKWVVKANGGDFTLLAANDNYNGFVQAMTVNRTGVAVDAVKFPNGKVGIGAAPDDKLTVAGSVHVTTGGVRFPDGSLQTTAGGGGVNPASNVTWTGVHTWTSSATFKNAGFSVGGSTLTVVGGKVGVGTATPQYSLDVAGTVNAANFLKNGVPLAAGGVQPGDNLTWTGAHTWESSTTFKNRNLSIGGSDFIFKDGRLGMGVANPDAAIHMRGNIFLENDPVIEILMRRNDLANRPMFKMGRIVNAGDGDPEFRFLYVDDVTPEHTVFEFDKKGILASVKPGFGSHFEGFIGGDSEPLFRLNSAPAMQLEMGPGGSTLTDVALRRVGPNAIAFFNRAGGETPHMQTETLRIEANGNVRIPQHDLMLRVGTDDNHGLGWYGAGRPFAGVEVDGPVLYGWSGGALGSHSPDEKIAVSWNNAGNVGVGTAAPNAKLHVSGGDLAVTTAGSGVILKATDGANCFRVTVNNAGALSTAPTACP